MVEQPNIKLYEHWESQRKMFNSITRQLYKNKQKDEERKYKPLSTLQETIDDVIYDMRH